jgi:hypothetical protein
MQAAQPALCLEATYSTGGSRIIFVDENQLG